LVVLDGHLLIFREDVVRLGILEHNSKQFRNVTDPKQVL